MGILDPLRGLAALSVAWYHFTHGNGVAQGWLKETGRYGWLGVEVFFVISGFVIPYSMRSEGYRPGRHCGRFLLKRLVRLEPPYLASVAVVLALLYLGAAVPGFRGEPPDVAPAQVLLHVGYLNGFFEYPWLNPVYWTLGIELQYYLLIAAAFPVLTSARPHLRVGAMAALCGSALLVPSPLLVFRYLGLFSLGILAFQYLGRVTGPTAYLGGTAAVAAVTWAVQGPEVAAVGLATAAAIVFVRLPEGGVFRLAALLGTVSYSLYLLHVPVGGRVCNLGGRYAHSPEARVAVLVLAMGVSLLAAVAFHRLVERPSQRLAARVGYA